MSYLLISESIDIESKGRLSLEFNLLDRLFPSSCRLRGTSSEGLVRVAEEPLRR